MSGVYVRGMELPVTCCHCAFMYFDPDAANSNNGNPGSYLCSFTKAEIWNTQRDPQCPLVSVPDHGELIDADELLAVLHLYRNRLGSGFSANEVTVCMNKIREAKTVIAADGG